jgi:hypothetical protein
MSNLSPEAKALVDAFNAGFKHPLAVHLKPRIALTLRELVNQLKYIGITEKNILDIAKELEQTNGN